MASSLLEITRLNAHYGELQVLYDVDLSVDAGEVVSIVGANGAGKTTFLKSLCGLMNRGAAARAAGAITFAGERIEAAAAADIVRRGIALVPEGRRLFSQMTVAENLLCGAHTVRDGAKVRATLDSVYGLFPRLAERRAQIVSRMSGGEQQMVAIGRALMSSPKLVLFDELSLGLAPAVIDLIYERIEGISRAGITCIIIEQSLSRALKASSKTIVLREGSVALRGRPSELPAEAIEAAYFGSGDADV